MKTRVSQSFFTAVMVVIALLMFSAAAYAAEYVTVNKDEVNIRSGPSTRDKVIWQVFEGFPLQVIERRGRWTHIVDFEGDEGWIYDTLISSRKSVIVNVETANMRSGPSTEENVIATVKKGVVFEPLEMRGDWIRIRYKDDFSGWMHNSLVWPANPF